MFKNLCPDKAISKDELIDGRMEKHGIQVEVDGPRSAVIRCDGSKMLVRFDNSNNVDRLIPVDYDESHTGTTRILFALGTEFDTTFFAGVEDAYHLLFGDPNEV